MSCWRVRAARAADLGALADLQAAGLAGPDRGFAGAPDDWVLLAESIATDGRVGLSVGSIRVSRNIGLEQPRYWFHVGCVVHAAVELRLFHRSRTLLIGNDHTGAIELADLHCDRARLSPTAQLAVLQLLVRAALLLLAREVDGRADKRLIAELPGREFDGQSPFWEGVGRHFYPGDPAQARARFGNLWLTHVAALMPRHPLVVDFLQPEVQAVIGEVAANAVTVSEVLHGEGMRAGQHVSIYDAGAVFEAQLDLLQGVAQCRLARLKVLEQLEGWSDCLIARPAGLEVWSLPGQRLADEQLAISAETARLLGLHDGESIWIRNC